MEIVVHAGHHLHPVRGPPCRAASTPTAAQLPGGHEPAYAGYSIGKWVDEDGDGRFDTARGRDPQLQGAAHLRASGMPLHEDNQTVVKERIYLDKAESRHPARRDHRHRSCADPVRGR